jgi:hypothetical protein
MGLSKADFLELLATGEYYVLQKKYDWNLVDITLKRGDGAPAEIENYPYRINQMPAYIFRDFLAEGFLKAAGTDELGGTLFRPVHIKRKPSSKAA